jgi:general secretion pathway protein A
VSAGRRPWYNAAVASGDHPARSGSCEQFFGFHEPPFSLAPNPRFLFESTSHGDALSQVALALERREPVAVITGEIGTGKTMLCRTLLQRARRKTFVSVVNDPLLERDDLLKQLLEDFGVISKDRSKLAPTSRHDLVHALEHFLASLIPLQAHAVVIIDEAQHLKPDVLEQIRLLSNIDDERGTMLQIILVGQTDLEPLLSRPELRQFQQRVSRRFRLEPLSAAEVKQYIEHRLAVARGPAETPAASPGSLELERALIEWDDGFGYGSGGSSVLFTEEAIQEVAARSGGLPRLINILCDRALEMACAKQVRTIDAPLIVDAAAAVNAPAPAVHELRVPALAAVTPHPATSAPAVAAHETVPFTFTTPAPAAGAPNRMLMLVAAAAVAAVLVWFGMQVMNSPSSQPPETPGNTPPAASAPAPAAPPSRAPAVPPPAAATPVPGTGRSAASPPNAAPPANSPSGTATPPPASTTGAATTGASGAPAAAPTAAATEATRFEIVVASFRTVPRADAVAAGVEAVGLPTRRREAAGWQQVLAGPFKTRAEAEAAQQRLTQAGFEGTQISPSLR